MYKWFTTVVSFFSSGEKKVKLVQTMLHNPTSTAVSLQCVAPPMNHMIHCTRLNETIIGRRKRREQVIGHQWARWPLSRSPPFSLTLLLSVIFLRCHHCRAWAPSRRSWSGPAPPCWGGSTPRRWGRSGWSGRSPAPAGRASAPSPSHRGSLEERKWNNDNRWRKASAASCGKMWTPD